MKVTCFMEDWWRSQALGVFSPSPPAPSSCFSHPTHLLWCSRVSPCSFNDSTQADDPRTSVPACALGFLFVHANPQSYLTLFLLGGTHILLGSALPCPVLISHSALSDLGPQSWVAHPHSSLADIPVSSCASPATQVSQSC